MKEVSSKRPSVVDRDATRDTLLDEIDRLRARVRDLESGSQNQQVEQGRELRTDGRVGARANEFLAEASEILSHTLDPDRTLESIGSLIVPRLADFCFIDLIEPGGGFTRTAVAHASQRDSSALERMRRRYPAKVSIYGVTRTAESRQSQVVNGVTDDILVELSRDEEELSWLRSMGIRAFMCIPMAARARTFAVITLVGTEQWTSFDRQDLALAEDLARRAALAIENARLFSEAQEANRGKDEFLATLSHELRTPLTAVLGWASALRMRKVDEDTLSAGLEAIERGARIQAQLINDVFDVSRIITGKLRLDVRPIQFDSVVENALAAVRLAADARRIRIEVRDRSFGAPVLGDASRLQQVVWNLVSNAIKFTEPGGVVTIELERKNDSIVLCVSDTGKGISSEFLPFVFDRFRQGDTTTTRQHGGLGLGLALVKYYVELHGGSVTAASEGPGRGSTFSVMLPAGIGSLGYDEYRRLIESDQDAFPRLEGYRILAIEDQPDTREFVASVLRLCGAEVVAVDSAEAGLVEFDRRAPDVLISDIAMPNDDGFSFLRRIRDREATRGGHVPALALSAFGRNENRAELIELGFQEYLQKPIDAGQLVQTVSALIRNGK